VTAITVEAAHELRPYAALSMKLCWGLYYRQHNGSFHDGHPCALTRNCKFWTPCHTSCIDRYDGKIHEWSCSLLMPIEQAPCPARVSPLSTIGALVNKKNMPQYTISMSNSWLLYLHFNDYIHRNISTNLKLDTH
jgi:hypothetical protein